MNYNGVLLAFLFLVIKLNGLLCANTTVWGVGLNPVVVLPARYFYVKYNEKITNIKNFNILINGKTKVGNNCRIWTNILDRKDSSFIVRYKLYEICYEFNILVEDTKAHRKHVNNYYKGPIYPDDCSCKKMSISSWLANAECKTDIIQINSDLGQFKQIDFNKAIIKMIRLFQKNPHSISVCQYVVKNNLIFRKCYGDYTGFKLFMDNLLLSLSRKVFLPDMEFFVNLGDWPLSSLQNKMPIFSWCGSNFSADIIMPTYDITESSIENMGRVSLDMLSVQGNIDKTWSKKIQKAFWMGRDSSKHRLHLVDISKSQPHLINASITNFFFYKELKQKYGSGKKPISFFKFFDYKYQINVDGTVAAYRFPYLLVGDSLVFKQESDYYEHFYNELIPWVHYVPIKRNLDNLVELVNVMIESDRTARIISLNGQKYARDNLAPHNILGYYLVLFQKYSRLLVSTIEVREDMEEVKDAIPPEHCDCENSLHFKMEL
ncbi:Lipopolysaccharide-modifying protein [Cinara cedri]|uniref:Lipopolysaccharide-modifying protein n=1 Tax=Cinara cedri TaxID=506608 RepID=A0A5E4M471_9HEMI|nr:Lipopolysaccharide-modifying protein [Cinara cedri]